MVIVTTLLLGLCCVAPAVWPLLLARAELEGTVISEQRIRKDMTEFLTHIPASYSGGSGIKSWPGDWPL
jgi:hypothetical protein